MTQKSVDILVVDDEADIRQLVSGILEDEGYQARAAANSDETLAALAERRPALLILDIWLKGSKLDGLEILDEVKRVDPLLPVLIISGHGNLDTAVSAIRRGAYDFIEKPFQADTLLHAVARATETERLRREVEELRQIAPIDTELTGTSQLINAVRATIRRVSATGSRVLIKPNMSFDNPPEWGTGTSPEAVVALAKLCEGPFQRCTPFGQDRLRRLPR